MGLLLLASIKNEYGKVIPFTLKCDMWFFIHILTSELFKAWMSYYIPCKAHYDVIKWNHFTRYRPLVRGIHRSPVNSPDKCQWCGALMFSLNCAWINGWVNKREAGDLGRHRAHYDVTVMNGCCFVCPPRLPKYYNLGERMYIQLSSLWSWIFWHDIYQSQRRKPF